MSDAIDHYLYQYYRYEPCQLLANAQSIIISKMIIQIVVILILIGLMLVLVKLNSKLKKMAAIKLRTEQQLGMKVKDVDEDDYRHNGLLDVQAKFKSILNKHTDQSGMLQSPLKKNINSWDLIFRSIKDYNDEPKDSNIKKRLDDLIEQQMKKMKDSGQMEQWVNKYMDRPVQYFMQIWMLNYNILYQMISRKSEECFPRWYLDGSGHMNVLVLNILGLLILLIVVNAYLNMNVGLMILFYIVNIGFSVRYNMNMIKYTVIPQLYNFDHDVKEEDENQSFQQSSMMIRSQLGSRQQLLQEQNKQKMETIIQFANQSQQNEDNKSVSSRQSFQHQISKVQTNYYFNKGRKLRNKMTEFQREVSFITKYLRKWQSSNTCIVKQSKQYDDQEHLMKQDRSQMVDDGNQMIDDKNSGMLVDKQEQVVKQDDQNTCWKDDQCSEWNNDDDWSKVLQLQILQQQQQLSDSQVFILFVVALLLIFLIYVVLFKMDQNQYIIVMMLVGLVIMDILVIRPLVVVVMGYIQYAGYKKGYGLGVKILRVAFIERNIAYQLVVKTIIAKEQLILEQQIEQRKKDEKEVEQILKGYQNDHNNPNKVHGVLEFDEQFNKQHSNANNKANGQMMNQIEMDSESESESESEEQYDEINNEPFSSMTGLSNMQIDSLLGTAKNGNKSNNRKIKLQEGVLRMTRYNPQIKQKPGKQWQIMVNAMNGGVDGDDVILKTDDEHLNMSPSAIGYTAAANKVVFDKIKNVTKKMKNIDDEERVELQREFMGLMSRNQKIMNSQQIKFALQ